jgi:hypothetical protein
MMTGLDVIAPLYTASTKVRMKFHKIAQKEARGAALKRRRAQVEE